MNHKRNLKRKIRTKQRWVYFHGAVCIALFTWFMLSVCFERQTDITNLYQIICIAYSAYTASVLETQIEEYEAELMQLGFINK